MTKNYNLFSNKIILSFLAATLSMASLAMEENQTNELSFGEMTPEPPPKPSRLKRAFSRVMEKRHSKPRGILDPNLPVNIVFRPTLVKLPLDYQLPKSFRVINGKLDLKSITPDGLWELSGQELDRLLDFLSKSKVKIKWWNSKGEARSGKNRKHANLHFDHWDHSNAAAALTMDLSIRSERELVTMFLMRAPEAILPEFDGEAMSLIDMQQTAEILASLVHRLDSMDSGFIARAAATITALVLKYWTQKDLEKLNTSLTELMENARRALKEDDNTYKEEKIGLLLGSVLAGSLKYAEFVKDKDSRRLVIVNAVANLVWAATSFIGVVPLALPVTVTMAGTISVAAVVSSIAANELGMPRNYCPKIKEIEGVLELASLQSARLKNTDGKLDVLMTLSWMRAAIHVNGFAD